MRVELIGAPPSTNAVATVRPMPSASARAARKPASPPRRWPNAKSGPQVRCAAPMPRCSTSAANSSAVSVVNAASNSSSYSTCTPSAASAAARSACSVRRNGGSSGRNSSRGCGSKVRTASFASGRAPCAARSTWACPRWTPSKLPSATEAPRSASGRPCQVRTTSNGYARLRGSTVASPSMTTLPATVQVVRRVARFLAGSSARTSAVAVTVSPMRTGRRKLRVCAR